MDLELLTEGVAGHSEARKVTEQKQPMESFSVSQKHFVQLALQSSLVSPEERGLKEQAGLKATSVVGEVSVLMRSVEEVEAEAVLMGLSQLMVEVEEVRLVGRWMTLFVEQWEEAAAACWLVW